MPEHVTPEIKAHPVLYLVLFLPMGLSNGYVVVTLGYLLANQGHVSVAAVGWLGALSLMPQTWKFFWAPLVDTTLTIKGWFLLSAIATGLLMAATAFIAPVSANLTLIEVMVVAFSLASSFNAMAADSIMAHTTGPDEKGRAGGWSQAGNLGGSGLGGGAVLWLSQHPHADLTSAAALMLACLLPCVALLFVKEPPAAHRAVQRYVDSVWNVLLEVWDILKRHKGALASFIMLLPIGVGSAQNLWSAISGDWHASANTVALATGVLSGVVSMVGCIVGGVICDKMDRKTAYCVFGIVLALCAVGMALAPRTETMYVVFTTAYNFITGFCYAAFGAIVLESIGGGAAATKYNVLAGISNLPIAYQTVIDGWGHDKWGANGLLYADALCGIAGVALFAAVALASRRLYPRWAAA
ncbi:MAG TPA: MFS transporter [Rhizomicrobium sp.]|jgi:MFS family permease|nr:MFS transporter [Rhizomicrobium sp.]